VRGVFRDCRKGGLEVDVASVGLYIKERRKQLKLTQVDVADFLGVSAQAVSKWERGENLPDAGLFTDLAKVLEVSIEGILSAGAQVKQKSKNQNLVDDELFQKALEKIKEVQSDVVDVELDFYVYLSSGQKMEVVRALLKLRGYGMVLDEILPYSGQIHKAAILAHVLANREYELLEQMTPFMSNDMKADALSKLLVEGRLEIIEDIITAFNRKHRDMIVEYFTAQGAEDDRVEDFMPFFDRNQIKRLLGEEN